MERSAQSPSSQDLNSEAPSAIEAEVSNPDELLRAGLEKIKNGEIEDAAELLSKASNAACQLFGPVDAKTAPFYYHYGDALLRLFEDSKNQNWFGASAPQEVALPKGKDQIREEPINSPPDVSEPQNIKPDCNGNPSEEDSTEPKDSEEPELEEGDLQLCWETLETCRVILKRDRSDLNLLYLTHLRIGDLETWKEHFEEGRIEYQEALEVLKELEGGRGRRSAEVYYLIGINCLYKEGREAQAAENFSKALEVLKDIKNASANPNEVEELEGLISDISLKLDDAFEQQRAFQTIRESQLVVPQEGLDKPQFTGEVKELGVFGKRKRTQEPCEFESKRSKLSP